MLLLLLLSLIHYGTEASPLDHAMSRESDNLGRRGPGPRHEVFDYIVVGGGTAGLVIANRLIEDPKVTVAVIEAGDFYEKLTGNASEIPANDILYNGKSPEDTGPVDWDFVTTPQAVSNL